MEARGKGPQKWIVPLLQTGGATTESSSHLQQLPHPGSPNGPLVAIIKIKQGKRCGGANQLRLINWENNLTVMEMSMEQSNSLPPIHQSSD